MPLDMQKWMAMVLNLSEIMGVPGAATFPIPVVSPSPGDSVEAYKLSFGQNDEAGGPDDEALSFESLLPSSSMNDLSDLLDLMEETKQTE
jgi:hypothetical protein